MITKTELEGKYRTVLQGNAEQVTIEGETGNVKKGTMVLFGETYHGVVIFPVRHDLLHLGDDTAHPGECHDFGLSNYIVIRNLNGNPYPLDIYLCRRPSCSQVMVLDPLSKSEIAAVTRRPISMR